MVEYYENINRGNVLAIVRRFIAFKGWLGQGCTLWPIKRLCRACMLAKSWIINCGSWKQSCWSEPLLELGWPIRPMPELDFRV